MMESAQLHDSLRRLLPHVDRSRLALTGGVAIELHLGAARGERTRGSAAVDIDLVAAAPDAVSPTVTADFLVSHFHLPQPGYPKFLIQLVDGVTGLRLDVFPDSLHALPRACTTDVAGVPLLVLRASDILDHKLATLARGSGANPVDPKHYEDAKRLGAACGRGVPPIPAAHLAAATYSRNVDETCVRCDVSRCAAFPLAAKQAILDILGHV
jgi:hypothetical protein